MRDYNDCLKLAGAEVIAYERFGSYQGDWLAKVKHDGAVKWIHGYYGSCSWCDEIEDILCQVEFDDETAIKSKLMEIGARELASPSAYADLLNKFKTDSEWDGDAIQAINFLEQWGEA